MGLKSLISVAEGKNAGNVSVESGFMKEYDKAVEREARREWQPHPKDAIRPSSMYGCERMIFFNRVYGGKQDGEIDVGLTEICDSGTDRHLRIQKLVADMDGVTCLDLEEVVKEANQRGINTEFLGWNEDKTEGRCVNRDLHIFFQPDGVIRYAGKDLILEIKTESTYQFSKRYEPKEDHKWQTTCYGMGLGIDYVLFFYEDRNFCNKKAYLWRITDDMKEAVRAKIETVEKALKDKKPPMCNPAKCAYCEYKDECDAVNAGKWEYPGLKKKAPRKKKSAGAK